MLRKLVRLRCLRPIQFRGLLDVKFQSDQMHENQPKTFKYNKNSALNLDKEISFFTTTDREEITVRVIGILQSFEKVRKVLANLLEGSNRREFQSFDFF